MLKAEQAAGRSDDATARSEVAQGVDLLRGARHHLEQLVSTNDWQYFDVSEWLGTALTRTARLRVEQRDLLLEAELLLRSAWDVLDQTSRYPQELRATRRQRIAQHLAELFELKAARDGNPTHSTEAQRWRAVASVTAW